jgi:glucokinase
VPALTIGLDMGGTKCAGVVLDEVAAVVDEHRAPTPAGTDAVLATLTTVAATLRDRAPGAVEAVGIGLPGLVSADGVLRFAPHLVDLFDVPVAAELTARLGCPVTVDNDATCATAAEWQLGAAAGARHAVLVTFGTGIGGGLVVDGALVRGGHGFAGEFGHMTVDPDGPPCVCGRRGCWEQYASGPALAESARARAGAGRLPGPLAAAGGDPGQLLGEHVTSAAAAGDADALRLVDEMARWIALGLANLTLALDPERFVLGGGVLEPPGVVVAPVARRLASALGRAGGHRPVPDVVAAALGARAGAIGAALLARAASVPPGESRR